MLIKKVVLSNRDPSSLCTIEPFLSVSEVHVVLLDEDELTIAEMIPYSPESEGYRGGHAETYASEFEVSVTKEKGSSAFPNCLLAKKFLA